MMGFYPFGFGGIFMWFFLIMIVLMVINFARGGCGMGFCGHHSRQSSDKALDALKERFAKGEITKEEYEEKRKVLLG